MSAHRWTSMLFTPADRPERVGKAWRVGAADVVVADLEDAVAPSGKDAARDHVVRLLSESPSAPCRRAVRMNAPGTPAGAADLEALLPAMPDLLVIPKAEDPVRVEQIGDRIEREGGATAIVLVLESAMGVLRARELASVAGVAAVAFGAEDLAADAGMRRTPGNDEVAVPRSMVALAAAAARRPAIDMITADLADMDRFRREAVEARGLGFRGKMCIHPSQVEAARRAFAPSPDEIAWAHRVVAAAVGGGVVVVDGMMVDGPLVGQARRILEDA